jgi:hypothetical protein
MKKTKLSPEAMKRAEERAEVRIRRMKEYAANSKDRIKMMLSTPAPLVSGVMAGNKENVNIIER